MVIEFIKKAERGKIKIPPKYGIKDGTILKVEVEPIEEEERKVKVDEINDREESD